MRRPDINRRQLRGFDRPPVDRMMRARVVKPATYAERQALADARTPLRPAPRNTRQPNERPNP